MILCIRAPLLSPNRVVKLSSPYLNVVIIIGAIFLYVTVIIIGVDKNVASTDTVDALCQVGGARGVVSYQIRVELLAMYGMRLSLNSSRWVGLGVWLATK